MDTNKFELIWKHVSFMFQHTKSDLGGRPMKHEFKDILEGIYWILDTGAQWRNLPKHFPPRSTCHYWLKKWSQNGMFEKIYSALIQKISQKELIDLDNAFIDGMFVRSKGAHEEYGKTKCGKGSKIMSIVDKNGIPISISVYSATPHEVKLVQHTLDTLKTDKKPQNLVGDKAYDCDTLRANLKTQNINMIAPHKKNRKKEKTQCDEELKKKYPKRHLIENFFALFQWRRRVLVRYEKKISNFKGFVFFQTAICILQKLGF
jgi:transposase